jgi:hypothetical protein
MKTELYIGLSRKIDPPPGGFLFIHDALPRIDHRRPLTFDPRRHSFNPFPDCSYLSAVYFIEVLDALFPRGGSTLTKDMGLDLILTTLLSSRSPSLRTLLPKPNKLSSPGHLWAYSKLQRIFLSPILSRVFDPSRHQFTFHPHRPILARIDKQDLGDFDAKFIALMLIAYYKGQLVIPDYADYALDSHIRLIQQKRLIAGINHFAELPTRLRAAMMLIPDKTPAGALYDDAALLAKFAHLRPDPTRTDNDYEKYIREAMD